MRDHYQALINNPEKIELILQAGAGRARAVAAPFMRELRAAVGLRKLAAKTALAVPKKSHKTGLAGFKQYREADGKFYFKLFSSEGKLLLQSSGASAPGEAAQLIALLHERGVSALEQLEGKVEAGAGVSVDEIAFALQRSPDATK